MKSGICFPSIGRSIAWGSYSSGWATGFPSSNLSKLDEPRRILRAGAPGNFNAGGLFGGDREVDFVALVHHNTPPGATFRMRLCDNETYAGPYVYDTGYIPFWPDGTSDAGYLNVRPILLPAPVTAKAILINVENMGAETFELGAVEVGTFWAWEDVNVPRGIGIESRSVAQEMGGGIDHVTQQWGGRIATGSRDMVDLDEVDNTLLDFHRARGRSQAFVWCWDVDDPATWARQAFLARNRTLPPGVAIDYEAGSMSYDFEEHLA